MGGPIVQGNPAQEAYKQALYRQLASLPPDVREFINQQYASTQISVLPLPYWSTIRFAATIAGNAAAIDTTPRKAFAYAFGGAMQVAGFPAGFRVANDSDTNLQIASQTRDNADVWIWGLAAHITEDSEIMLARRLWREVGCEFSLNGSNTMKLGTLEMFPSAGGLYGHGQSFLAAPATNTRGAPDGGPGPSLGCVQNGNPMAGSFFRFPQPFKWSGIGTAGTDSSLNITCTPGAAISQPISPTRAAVPVVAMVTPGTIEPFTQPVTGDLGTYVDIRWRLISVAVAKRSVNV